MKINRYVALIVLFVTACSTWGPSATHSPLPTGTPPSRAVSPLPTLSPIPSPTAEATPTPKPPAGPGLDSAWVYLFPRPLYEGDHVSASVTPRLPRDVKEPFTVTLTLPSGKVLSETVSHRGLDERPRARFYWVWTAPEDEERATLTFSLVLPPAVSDPYLADNELTVPVTLLPREALDAPEVGARWAVSETVGFRLHYLTGTAAERDLDQLLKMAAEAYADVETRFDVPEEPLDIYLMDRVVGQGGYASSGWVAISYADRQYAPVGLPLLFRHELTHRLDEAIGCRNVPTLIREGLAVYVSGGHYRPESLPYKSAALLQLDGRYIPLDELVENFYSHQHEIGYLEAGAVIHYLVEAHGWESLETLCRAAAEADASSRDELEAGLEALGYEGLDAFEGAWQHWLRDLDPDPREAALLEAELALLDAMREYQAAYDPGAHFMLGILFSPERGVEEGFVADFVRRPRDPEAVTLELLLAMGQEALNARDLEAVQATVDAVETTLAEGIAASPLASDLYAIAEATLARGYEPVRIQRRDGGYRVVAIELAAWPEQRLLWAAPVGDVWIVTGPQSEQ